MTEDTQGPGFYLTFGGVVIAYAAEGVDGPGFSLHADRPEDRDRVEHGWAWHDTTPTT